MGERKEGMNFERKAPKRVESDIPPSKEISSSSNDNSNSLTPILATILVVQLINLAVFITLPWKNKTDTIKLEKEKLELEIELLKLI